jgi:hypothetical protein
LDKEEAKKFPRNSRRAICFLGTEGKKHPRCPSRLRLRGGILRRESRFVWKDWIPAFAGMTKCIDIQ